MKYFIYLMLVLTIVSCGKSSDTTGDFAAPSNLRATTNLTNHVVLYWQDNSSEELGFIIQRKDCNSEFVTIDTTAFNNVSYIDENVEIAAEYIYRISALFEANTSIWSNEISITTASWFSDLNFGTAATFEVVTWNIEHFPKANQSTIEYAAQAIIAIDAEVFALQEIESSTSFQSLIDMINMLDNENEWSGFRANSASYDINLAYIYKNNLLHNTNIYEIFESDWYAFPRSPLVMEVSFGDYNFVIINNHLKAGGDTDDEARRRNASEKMNIYVNDNFTNENVIILGDLNDEIDEPQSTNVFWSLISEPIEYQFTDMDIANGSAAYWSYPSWPSHLDHILITNELFDEYENSTSQVTTLLIDSYLEGLWNEYDQNISDHRPVGLKLNIYSDN